MGVVNQLRIKVSQDAPLYIYVNVTPGKMGISTVNNFISDIEVMMQW